MFRQFIIAAMALVALNTSVRAEPLNPSVAGPKLVCFKYSVFTLNVGERVIDFSGSMEGILIKVKSSTSHYEIGESEIFAAPTGKKRLVSLTGKTSVYRIADRKPKYMIYGPTSYSEGEDVPLIWLSGAAIRSATKARQIFERFEVRNPRSAKCEQTFTYGYVEH